MQQSRQQFQQKLRALLGLVGEPTPEYTNLAAVYNTLVAEQAEIEWRTGICVLADYGWPQPSGSVRIVRPELGDAEAIAGRLAVRDAVTDHGLGELQLLEVFDRFFGLCPLSGREVGRDATQDDEGSET